MSESLVAISVTTQLLQNGENIFIFKKVHKPVCTYEREIRDKHASFQQTWSTYYMSGMYWALVTHR